jgi:hypothetical protein
MRSRAIVACVVVTLGAVLFYRAGDSKAQGQGAEAVIYWEEEGVRRTLVINETILDMPLGTDAAGDEYSWNDQITKIEVVRGTFRVYQHGRSNTELDDTKLDALDVRTKSPAMGWSCLISASAHGSVVYDKTNGVFPPNEISSIEVISDQTLPTWAQTTLARGVRE